MNNETVVGLSTYEKVIIIIVAPILGALLGWFIPTFADWLIKLPFIPFVGLLEWITTLKSQWVALLGVLAGILFILYVFSESLKMIITDEEVKLSIKENVEIILKKEISNIYMDGNQIVFLNIEGIELYRGEPESRKKVVSEAFSQHGYPWSEKDPFENQYQRWVADHPECSAHVNALLSARERALQKEKTEEASVLRKDLANLGIVIRDKNKRQYVRTVKR